MSRRARIRGTARALRQAPAVRAVARAGFIVNGVLHITIGLIAMAIALGLGGSADHDGALAALSSGPIGGVLLWVAVGSLLGLAAFQALTVIAVAGRTREAWLRRAKPGARAVAYGVLGFVAFRFAIGARPNKDEAQEVSAGLLAIPGGVFVVGAIGLAFLAGGATFVVMGIRRRFLNDLKLPRPWVRRVVRVLGVGGYIAEGIAFSTVGVLFLVASIRLDPSQAGGLDGALESLRQLPYGSPILGIVAVGFVLYGLYCFARGLFEQLDQPRR